jgi:minor extracellular serine protease Vpr
MTVRAWRVVLAGAVALGALTGIAEAAGPGRFTPEAEREITVPAGITPYALGAPVTVVLELAAAPVASVQAASAARLTQAERDAVASSIAASQDKVVAEVVARGGTVLATFQHAINGVKVSIPAAQYRALQGIPGVVVVRPVQTFEPNQAADPDNATGIPFIGGPAAWGGVNGFHGEHIKVAIIDTGIDYTHANFAGPGTPAAYAAAFASSAAAADPSLFGPNAPKVKGGIDLVGDDYDWNKTPVPDPNPLDCGGHGSHVAGTVAGFGVTSAGTTYTGKYTSTTVSANTWTIGPGVAPKADLYAVKVFGCTGSTNVVVDAIDWAVKNDMDVINMSLGSSFGTADSADAIAAENAAKAGVIVVASAGNSGFAPYITGAPAVGDRVISVAAQDVSVPTLPTASLGLLPAGTTIKAQVSNGASVPSATLPVVVLPLTSGYSGCTDAEFIAANVAGKLVVTVRGSCPRVDRAILGQKYGAAAVAMINNGTGYGIYEFEIPGVTIPFLGVDPADGPALNAATSVALAAGPSIPNPSYKMLASFSSGGPRRGDSKLKPSVTAPGVSVKSTSMGTGNQGEFLSGTSMASPHVAGVAALAVQAHPRWRSDDVRAAILSTALPGQVADYQARLAGIGTVQADHVTGTQVVAVAQANRTMNLSFGFEELVDASFDDSDVIEVKNFGKSKAVFDVTSAPTSTTPHTVTVQPSRISIAPGETGTIRVRLKVPAATAGDTSFFRDVAGLVSLVPASSGSNGGIGLQVPYYLVTRARSEVGAEARKPFGSSTPVANVKLENQGAIAGSADFYAWGPSGVRDRTIGEVNLRAAGVQSFYYGVAANRYMVFAVNTWQKFNTAASSEFDVSIDVNGDGKADFVIFSYDYGAMTTGTFSGEVGIFRYSYATGKTAYLGFRGDWLAPTDGSTVFLPVYASYIGITPANPRFSYSVQSYSWEGPTDSTVDVGYFNPFSNAIETGGWAVVPPKGKATVPVSINAAEWALSPPKGLMVVNVDDHSGKEQAELIPATAP